jgi:hypothetical protein
MRTIKDYLGMGLIQIPFYDKTGFGHTGGIDEFRSVFGYFPTGEISFAFTTNGIDFSVNDITITLLSAAYDMPFEIPEFTIYELTEEDLDMYLGIYASKQLPLKMTITKANNQLFGQGTGQPSFPLEAVGKDKFEFKQAGLMMEFNPTEKTMILRQRGGIFNFERE